ncbi:uncharacterized protein LOC124498244 [Dermatophagoides farinae]
MLFHSITTLQTYLSHWKFKSEIFFLSNKMKSYIAILVIVATMMMMIADAAPAAEDLQVEIPEASLRKYHPLLKKFGEKAKFFLRCMGKEFIEHCVDPVVNCIATRNVIGCIEILVCACKEGKECVHLLREKFNVNSTTLASVY